MSDLFGVDIAGIVLDAFTGQLQTITLHKLTSSTGIYGEQVTTETNFNGEGVRSAWDARTAVARGYPQRAVKLLVLQLPGFPAPVIGDEATIDGDRIRIVDVEKDPVNATWTLAGEPI